MFKIGKKLILTLAIIGAIFGLVSCTKGEDIVRVKIEKDNFELIVGEQMELMPIVTKGGISTEANLGFKSYDESVATYVDGKITAIAAGETMVKVYDIDHPLAYATATVVVKLAESLNATFSYETSMFKGEEQLINCELSFDSKDSIVSYKSANPDIATVDENGNVVAVSTGNAVILAKVSASTNPSDSRDYALYITVIESDYKINYVLDGGVNNEANPAGFNVLELPLLLAEPTKKGYTFLGWYINDEKVDEIAAGTVGDVTVVAKWEKATFFIQYELDGGQNAEANLSEYSALDLPLTLQPATKTGYKFLGWYNGETQVTEITEETLADYELVAKWEKEVYALDLELNGGQVILSADTSSAVVLQEFVITDYLAYNVNGYEACIQDKVSFGIWWNFISLKETEVKGVYQIVQIVAGASKVTEPYDLVISWHSANTESIKANLDSMLNNASKYVNQYVALENVPTGSTKEANITVKVLDASTVKFVGAPEKTFSVDDEVVLPQLAKEGYNFLGWYNGETKVEKVEKGTTESVKLVAQFEAIKYELNLNLDGGQVIPSADTSSAVVLQEFVITDYLAYNVNGYEACIQNKVSFGIWWNFISLKETEVKGVYQIVQIVAGASKVTEPYDLVISWHSANTESIKANLDSMLNNASKYVNQYVVLENVPTESTKEANITVKVLDAKTVKIVTEAPTTYTIEDSFALPQLVKEGYNFLGWFDGETKVEKIEKGSTGAKAYTAKWEKIVVKHSLEFVLNDGTCENLPTEYEEGTSLALPTPTKEGYKFLGWFTNEECTGEAVIEVSAEANNDLKFYAAWEKVETPGPQPVQTELVVDPTDPTAYKTITEALAAATTGTVITVKAGTYDEVVSIDKEDIVLKGANAGIAYNEERVAETVVNQFVLSASAKNVIIDGFKFTAITAIEMNGGENISIQNNIMGATATANGQAIISILAPVSNLTVANNSFTATNPNNNSHYRAIMSGDAPASVNNAVIENNYFYTDSASSTYIDSVRIWSISGTINISNNTFDWPGDNFTTFIGGGTIAENAVIIHANNTYKGSKKMSGTSFRGLNNTTKVYYYGNTFDNVAGTIIEVRGSSATDSTTTITLDFKNNAVLNTSTNIRFGLSQDTITAANNYYFQNANYLATKPAAETTAETKEAALAGMNLVTVNYVCEQGTLNYAQTQIVDGLNYTLATTLPVVAGYEFAGWYNNPEFTGEPVTTVNGATTLYAKFNRLVKTHSVQFVLNDGTCENLPTEYEEGTVVALPTPTRTGYNFLGWYENAECTGEAVTEISADANTDLTFYAAWEEVVVTPTTELVVDANDSAAYQTIGEALAVAEEGYVIKVAAGTYSEELSITVSNITIMGPNAGVNGQDTRAAEAVITGAVTIAANNVVLDGLKFSEDGAIKLGASDNVTITNAYIDATPIKSGGTNRYGSITTVAECSNILVSNTYMNSGTNGGQRSNIASDHIITNFVVENSLLENNVTNASALCEAVHLYRIAGEIIIRNNEINCTTDNYALYLGTSSNQATLIEIKDNVFNGYNNIHTAGLRIQSLGAGAVFNFVHNYVHNMAGNTFNFDKSNSDSEINIMYNYFDASYPYKLSNPGSAKITYKDNFYEVAQTTATSDYGVIKSLDELETAYGTLIEWVKVNYELNGGTLPEDAPTEFNADRGLQSLPTPTQNGMVFMGWEMNGQDVTEIPAGTKTDVTLVAKWREDAIYVGTSTEDYVLPTLQAALDVAKPGDKIILLPGTYNEIVSITIADLTIAGPNQNVNPNKDARKEEAVYTGTIVVYPTAVNLTINGLAFTGNAKIENSESANYSGFRFLNNKVYDTTKTTDDWNSGRYATEGFIEFRLTSSGSTRNFIYKNNLFENVSATNILSNRSINVIVEGNVFRDFDRDAFRTAGGYVYGTLLFTDNVFEQTKAGNGNHAMFFKALAGSGGTVCTVIIKNNTFKNIGSGNSAGSPYQGAISSDIFQENNTSIYVEGNIFDHCYNYLWLRNNGANTTTKYWGCTVKNNQFLGLPNSYYFGTYSGSDTEATNPHLAVFGENYYEDNDGNVITDLSKYAAMFKHLSTYGTATSTKPGKAEVEVVEFYQISYDVDGGTIRGSYETGYTNAITSDIKLPTASKTNHDFLGWMLNGEIVTVIPATSRGDIKLVASWQQQAGELYDVTYNFDGGYSEALLVQNCGNAPTLPLNNFDYNGGTFWGNEKYTTDIFISTPSCDPGATFSDRIYIGKNNETGLYEVLSVITSGASSWAAGAEYVITISSSYQGSLGGYWGAINPITAKIKVGQMVAFDKAIDTTSLDSPTNVYFFDEKPVGDTLTVQHRYTDKLSGANQLGYKFLGWYDEQGNKWENLNNLTGAITLTAKWEQLNPVTSIKVDAICDKLLTGDTFQIVASVQPDDAYFKQLSYVSSNTDILSVDANGKITAINAGKATITIWDYIKKVKYEKEITVNAITSVDVTFAEEFDGVLAPEETIQLVAKAFGENTANATFTYVSSDTNVLTVSETGLVTAVAEGTANVTITMVGTDKTLVLPIVVKTFSQETEIDKLLALLVENNKAVVQAGNISLYNDGVERVYVSTYGSVNRFLFDKFEINTDYYAKSEANPNNHKSRREGIDTIEFVTVHDTATLTGTVESIASNMSGGTTSIHYTVGNDAIFGVVPEKYIAYHAGDSTGYEFGWTETNVKAPGNVAPKFEVVEVAGTTYLALNGQTTDIVIPQRDRNGVKSNMTTADLTHLGPVWRVVDGYYYIGGPIWYSKDYNQIGSRGGNNNSIGIEMCSNMSGDIYDTFQRTARLVADILIRNNLDTTRVKMHNTWTGKNCPQTMIAGNFWGEFMEMVELQYEVNTTYKDATITINSKNPDIIDNTGRVVNAPAVTTVVSYDLTVTLGSETRTITLHNVVPGTTTWEQWDGSYSARTIWNNGNYSIN